MPFKRDFLEGKSFTTKGFSVQKLLTMARFLPGCSGNSLVICHIYEDEVKYKNKKREKEKEESKNAIKISIINVVTLLTVGALSLSRLTSFTPP